MINSDDIEYALMSDRASGATMLPRYTPFGWWECDVAELTDSGYFREYEIKMSRADLTRDAHKSGYVKTGPEWSDMKRTTKHELLAATGKIENQTDSPRYKQAGNGVTSSVAAWIAKRIVPFFQ